ncbi:hypothetical protein V5N11_030917 [Cardamine amara subsp. amara]|uniref:Uncharacterized protein n=1 Tax=Cardamine amara subsp. amara TaxID=228776 RepID=A0ABD0ZHW5_CARAN
MVDGLELKVMVDKLPLYEEIFEEVQPVMCYLSLNSFLGKHSPRTTKLLGRIGKHMVVVLMDSGASHNFITHVLASKLRLKSSTNTGLEVLLGNGVSVHGSGVCKNVKFALAGVEF